MSEKETLEHVDQVRRQINYVISALNIRAAEEYASKLRDTTIIPEVYAAHLAGQAHGRKEALEWVRGFIGEVWRDGEKVPYVDAPVFLHKIAQELSRCGK